MMAAATWFAPQVNAQGGARSIPVSFKVPAGPLNEAAPEVSELAKKTQVELYSGANSLVWESAGKKLSVCNFMLNDVRHRALYGKNGAWRWTEKSYKGTDLDKEIRTLIFQNYGEVTIEWVDEVTMPNADANYFVVISADKLIRRVRVVDGNIDTLEEFAKK